MCGETLMLNVQVCRTFSDLAAMRERWEQLVAATDYRNVFLTPVWCETWCQAFAREGTLRVLCLNDGQRLVAIAPFVLTTTCGVRTLRWIGHGDADYLGILCAPEDLADAVWTVLAWLQEQRRQWDIVHWRDIDEATLALLAANCPPEFLSISRMSEVCPYIPIDGTWEEFMARRGGRFRRLRQTVRKCHKHADVAFHYAGTECITPEEIERDIRTVDGESWKAAEGRTMFRPAKCHFWRALLPRILSNGQLLYCMMRINDEPAAYAFCFDFNRKLYGWGTSFRERFRQLSPGTVLIERILSDAFAAGYREFDFMRGDEAYKTLWTTDVRNNYEYVMLGRTLRTRVAVDVFYRRRWALRGNPYARRAKIAYRVVRERFRRTLASRQSHGYLDSVDCGSAFMAKPTEAPDSD